MLNNRASDILFGTENNLAKSPLANEFQYLTEVAFPLRETENSLTQSNNVYCS